MRARRRVLAGTVLVTAWAPALASLVLAGVFRLPELPVPGAFLSASPPIVQSRFDDIGVTVALIYGALAATLIVRRPHPVTAILVVHAIGSALAAFGVQWGLLAVEYPGLPAAGLLLHAAGWGYLPGTIATTFVPLLVLGRPLSRLDRGLIAVGGGLAIVAFLAGLVHQAPGAPPNPFAIPHASLQELLPAIYAVAVTAAVALSVVVAIVVAARWQLSTGIARRRLGWLVVGHVFLTVSYGALILPDGVPVPDAVWEFGMVAPVIGQIFYPSAVLVLVLGPRLRAVDVRVSAVLTATILAVAAATGYALLMGMLAGFAPWPAPVSGVVAAVVVALALVPGRVRLRRGVERLVWGDDDPAQLVRRLGERVGELEPGGQGLAQLAQALRDAARLGWVSLRAVSPGGPSAETGRRPREVLVVPLRAAGATVGELEVAPPPGERLRRATRRDLAGLSPVLAVALRLVEANAALARARDDVLAARHAERRVLRRELHDGLGPALAGIGFGLAAVDRRLDSDPRGASELARRLADDLGSRVRDVRALVRAIGPDAADHDLAADLAELARDFSEAGPRFELALTRADEVPPAARRALSLIASEAVHNAVRHSGASTIGLLVRPDGDAIVLEISDDGRGFDPDARPTEGVGLVTMRERATEVGGLLDIVAAPGRGSAVRVILPSSRLTLPEVSA